MTRACVLALLLAPACGTEAPAAPTSHERMLALLREVRDRTDETNPWLGDGHARELRPLVAKIDDDSVRPEDWWRISGLGWAELWLGREHEAITNLERARRLFPGTGLDPQYGIDLDYRLGVAYLRLAETSNCCARNTPVSCILPLRGEALHTDETGARAAIRRFTEFLEHTPEGTEPYLSARWLLNIAYMTVGEHPKKVPGKYLIPDIALPSEEDFPRFPNVAARVGLDTFSLSGGAVAEDFDEDGDLDLLVSTWETSGQIRYHENNGDGTFVEKTEEAGLKGILGGLNMVQGDYDNDGHVDVFVLRGAWLERNGRHPNSLLRNLGGRFRDVTFAAGLADVHYPTQTAGWADYDNDGDLDLYVGNESGFSLEAPGQLFRNNGDGTFTDVAKAAGVANGRYAKGVSWGDYDSDGFPDLFVSNLQGRNRLYHNDRDGTFTDVAPRVGLTAPIRSFPCWFWDFDNDGNLDLYVSAYAADICHLAADRLGLPFGVELARLWRGDGKGGFENVARRMNLTRPNSPMGANFGDLDNDGRLDFYLGTGFPSYDTLMTSVMYRNRGSRGFVDVTLAGGFAHLQKGHAVVFADLDGDGDQDVFEEMGGAFKGDGFYNALYENPGFGNHWIAIRLVGTRSNRSAIGARIRVTAGGRSIFRTVTSGGSFGANPLRQSIGLGTATRVDRLAILWPTTGETQVLRGLAADQVLTVVEPANRE